MTTHDVIVYHCLACGRVVDAEQGAEPPQCCGSVMVNACPETSQIVDSPATSGRNPQVTPPAEVKAPPKSIPGAP
jgi:DNA-directed RNA polymerase subunit RPC12/RpoP